MSKFKVEDLELASGYTFLMLKAEEGNLEEVRRMIHEVRGTDINATNKKGYTALALAVKAGHLNIVKFLIYSGADPNTKNNSGQNALFLACWNNHEDIANLLLDNGAEINSVDHRGWTPLMISAYHGRKNILRELLYRNADTSIQDLFGKKAIDRAKDPDIIKMLQNSRSIDARARNVSITPKENASLQYSPIPYGSADKLEAKDYFRPVSILKKSSSKISIGASRTEDPRAQSFISPQTPQTLNLSAQKSPSMGSTQRRTVGTHNRATNSVRSTQTGRKEPHSASRSGTPLLKSFLQNAHVVTPKANSRRISASPTGGDLNRQVFKEDMEKLLYEQMGNVRNKVQQIVEHKITLDVPMQLQGYENQFKEEVESILRFKAVDIFKNLQTILGLKLKFCLSRLGYDMGNAELTPLLESATNFNPQMISFNQEPLRTYKEKEYVAIDNDINRLEKNILSQKVPQASSLNKRQADLGGHQCDHTSQAHRSEIRNDLLDQMGQEMRKTTDYLLDFSKNKVIEMTREETGMLYKRILAEVTDNMEALENELKSRFEELVVGQTNRIIEVLGSNASHNANSVTEVRSGDQTSPGPRNFYTSQYNSSENDYNRTSDLREERTESRFVEDMKREYLERKEAEGVSRGEKEILQTKEKILKIKNSLNFMDDEEAEPKSGGLKQSKGSAGGNSRYGKGSRPADVIVDDEVEDLSKPVRSEEANDPTYRSTMRSESTTQQLSNREYWNQPDTRNSNVPSKGVNKVQGSQGRGTADSKNGNKQSIPQHRFAFNNQKDDEQELIKRYNFSHE